MAGPEAMMILPTGKPGELGRPNTRFASFVCRSRSTQRSTAFTLIELIVVMTLLVVVIGIALPTLGNFFRGRTLDSEARRLLALTRQGQSRAVSEGLPVLLWVDAQQGTCGSKWSTSTFPARLPSPPPLSPVAPPPVPLTTTCLRFVFCPMADWPKAARRPCACWTVMGCRSGWRSPGTD